MRSSTRVSFGAAAASGLCSESPARTPPRELTPPRSSCSVEHQHLDWASHKSTCKLISSARTRGESLSETLAHLALPSKPQRAQFGQQMIPGAQLGPLPPTTKTVPLESAWPLFAVIASSARARSLFPVPEAIQRQIERVETLKDGSALVVMGKEHQMGAGGMKAWFPSAASEKVASRLFRRVTSDGWSAETALGIALGIREAMYEKRGVGLSYQGEPLTVRPRASPISSPTPPPSPRVRARTNWLCNLAGLWRLRRQRSRHLPGSYSLPTSLWPDPPRGRSYGPLLPLLHHRERRIHLCRPKPIHLQLPPHRQPAILFVPPPSLP